MRVILEHGRSGACGGKEDDNRDRAKEVLVLCLAGEVRRMRRGGVKADADALKKEGAKAGHNSALWEGARVDASLPTVTVTVTVTAHVLRISSSRSRTTGAAHVDMVGNPFLFNSIGQGKVHDGGAV